jgi:hypothetical protein
LLVARLASRELDMRYLIAAMTLALAGSGAAAGWAQEGGCAEGEGGDLRAARQADIDKLCADVEPGNHRTMQCLRDHQDQVSDECKSAMASLRAGHHGRHGWGGSTPGPSTPQT